MSHLEKIYKLKTGDSATWQHIEGERYTAKYVKWVEARAIEFEQKYYNTTTLNEKKDDKYGN